MQRITTSLVAFRLLGCQGEIYVAAWQRGSVGLLNRAERWGMAFERQFGALHDRRCPSPGTMRAGSTMATASVFTQS